MWLWTWWRDGCSGDKSHQSPRALQRACSSRCLGQRSPARGMPLATALGDTRSDAPTGPSWEGLEPFQYQRRFELHPWDCCSSAAGGRMCLSRHVGGLRGAVGCPCPPPGWMGWPTAQAVVPGAALQAGGSGVNGLVFWSYPSVGTFSVFSSLLPAAIPKQQMKGEEEKALGERQREHGCSSAFSSLPPTCLVTNSALK